MVSGLYLEILVKHIESQIICMKEEMKEDKLLIGSLKYFLWVLLLRTSYDGRCGFAKSKVSSTNISTIKWHPLLLDRHQPKIIPKDVWLWSLFVGSGRHHPILFKESCINIIIIFKLAIMVTGLNRLTTSPENKWRNCKQGNQITGQESTFPSLQWKCGLHFICWIKGFKY